MANKVNLYGWDGEVWREVIVNNEGKLIIDPSEIFENPPTEDEAGKAPTSEWAFDHKADPGAHHVPTTTIASDALRHSNDDLKATTSGTYTKVKEVVLNQDLPACRLKYDSQRTGSVGKARLYKNGVAIGTEQTLTLGFDTLSEDFSDWLSGDLIQIYAYVGLPTEEAQVKNMRVYYDLAPIVDITNQDP